MNYQPILGTSEPFQRRCEDRYEPIRELASKFRRPFSVFDFGANYGWFSFRLMEDFDCTCVLVDDKPIGDQIRAPERTVWLNRHLSGWELEKLSRCEHFDIVLGLSVLHHIPDHGHAFKALRNLGRWAFLEIPGTGDLNAANKSEHNAIRWYFDGEGLEPLAWFDSHVSKAKRPLYLLESDPCIFEQTIDARERDAPTYGRYDIESTFFESKIRIHREGRPHLNEYRDFIPGMNLHNFNLLGGGYPSQKALEAEMAKHEHPDKHPWNFILGYGVKPIDTVRKW